MIVPSKYQAQIYHDFEFTNDSLLVEAVAGSGKCLGRGTEVLLHNGVRIAVQNITPGMEIMGPDSKPRRVKSVTQGVGPLYRVVPVKGESWVCNDAHILVLAGTNRFMGETLEITVTEYLERCRRQKSFSSQWKLVRTGVEFPEANLEAEPYLVGLWLGDGTSNEVAFTTIDYEIIQYLAEAAPRYGAEAMLSRDRECIRVRFRVGPKGACRHFPLRRLLRNEFCIDGQKVIPLRYLTASRRQRLELLAGLIDTDGSLEGNCFDFVSKSYLLAWDVVYLARSLGFAAYMGKPKEVDGVFYYRLNISGEIGQVPCLLKHKKAGKRNQIKRVEVTGFTLEPLGDGEYFGFTLEGDGLFLLGNFTITHKIRRMDGEA